MLEKLRRPRLSRCWGHKKAWSTAASFRVLGKPRLRLGPQDPHALHDPCDALSRGTCGAAVCSKGGGGDELQDS